MKRSASTQNDNTAKDTTKKEVVKYLVDTKIKGNYSANLSKKHYMWQKTLYLRFLAI